MSAIGTKKPPVHTAAAAALVLAAVAIGLALYGAFAGQVGIAGTPLNAARGGVGSEATKRPAVRYTLEAVAFVLPVALGLGATALGAAAMRRIEAADGTFRGDAVAVFAIFLGGLAAVVGGVMVFAVYGWRQLPSLYTN